ncbi:MAG TPA: RES family NAD+ phosphorylase [Sphingomicrobium sp.]|nr:RES family NAD+ phosphorylase [Sphingomicrobium sp.]
MSTTSEHAFEPVPSVEDFSSYSHRVVRIVEEQYKISTDRLTDGPAEQDVLERLVEEVKPTLPAAAKSLHHLLGTPFRYGYSKPTRFRRANERPGIFYASESEQGAVAEAAYYAMRFFSAAPGVKLPTTTIERFGFSIPIVAERALDLTRAPLNQARRLWTQDRDYAACQRFATAARPLHAQLIRYESVRDPAVGANIALLDPGAFQRPVPYPEGSWHFRFRDSKVTVFAAGGSRLRVDFTFEQFCLVAPGQFPNSGL